MVYPINAVRAEVTKALKLLLPMLNVSSYRYSVRFIGIFFHWHARHLSCHFISWTFSVKRRAPQEWQIVRGCWGQIHVWPWLPLNSRFKSSISWNYLSDCWKNRYVPIGIHLDPKGIWTCCLNQASDLWRSQEMIGRSYTESDLTVTKLECHLFFK